MSENVGFGVAQTVEYGYYLETARDGRHGVCERAVAHFKPEFDEFLDRVNSHPPKGDLKEWLAGLKSGAIETAKGMAGESEAWARENHPWINRTGGAERGLTGYTVVDGARKPI